MFLIMLFPTSLNKIKLVYAPTLKCDKCLIAVHAVSACLIGLKSGPSMAMVLCRPILALSSEFDQGSEVIKTPTSISPNHRSKFDPSKVHAIGHKSITNLQRVSRLISRMATRTKGSMGLSTKPGSPSKLVACALTVMLTFGLK